MSNKLRQMKKYTKETKMRMTYECEKCGKSWGMWLQIGLEEHGKNYKPVPYLIMCKCGGLARHVRWNEDIYLSESIPITRDMNYFANVPDMDCGKPVLRKECGMMVDLTKTQCKNLAEIIEWNIFDIIRNDTDIDNIEWLVDIAEAYKKLKEGAE